MDREIASDVRRRRVLRRVVLALVAVTATGFLFATTVEWLRPSLDRQRIELARVERGVVEATLDANGTIVPLDEQVISSPVEARVLRIERRAGDRVKAGDELLTLDTAATRLEAERLSDRVAQRQSAHDELRLRLDEQIATLRAQIEQQRLDVEIASYTAQQRERLRGEGLTAEQDARAAASASKKAQIALRGLEEALGRAIRSRDVQLAAAAADVAMARREGEESRRQLELAMLRADRDGVLTSIITEAGATVRRGDVVARIADLSAYRVDATISDLHAARLSPGMRCRVELDGTPLAGRIENVDPRIVDGVARFTVVLDTPSHQRLRNNLRVDVEVITDARGNALVIRRGALGRSGASGAYVVRGDEAVHVPVRFGVSGKETIEVAAGLREGDVVVISDVSEFEGVRQLRLKGKQK
jgi:HlyD family secretion protein